jgi:hypothetical protein
MIKLLIQNKTLVNGIFSMNYNYIKKKEVDKILKVNKNYFRKTF